MQAKKQEIKIGLVGYGFMGKTHAYALQSLPFFFDGLPFTVKITGVATRSMEKSRRVASELGIPNAFDNVADLIASDVDVIDICTPNICHEAEAIAALRAGKHVYCEKPLADTADAAERMASVAAESDRICTVVFNNRHLAAVTRARQLIDEGRIGRILSFDFTYLHNSCTDPSRTAGWKQTADVCGKGGVLFDLGSHVLDLLVYLCGPVASVTGHSQIAFPERRGMDGATWQTDAPEAFYMLVKTKDGAMGTVTASKLATGTNDDLRFTVHGTKGAVTFSLMDMNFLGFYDATAPAAPYGGNAGYTRIECVGRYEAPAGAFPSPKAPDGWLRGHVMSMYRFLDAVYTGKQNAPSFADALYVQRIMDAALLSAETGKEVML